MSGPSLAHMARDGEQAAAAWKSVKRRPLVASLSMFGVLISPPKQDKSLKPRSSATITRKLGRFLELCSVMVAKATEEG